MRWPNSVVCECHRLTEPGPCATAAQEQVYTGGFANGLPHGFGKLRYPSGDVLEGEFNRECVRPCVRASVRAASLVRHLCLRSLALDLRQ